MDVRLHRADYFIGLYEPLIDRQVPYAIDQRVARTVREAKDFIVEFNAMACASPAITRLAGLFAYSDFPQVVPHVSRRKRNIEAHRSA